MSTIYLAGSGWFGHETLTALTGAGHQVVGVSSPADARDGHGSDLLRAGAVRDGIPWTGATSLRADAVPDGTDLIIAAHSHAFIGAPTRARAGYAVGYHPSLLPLHRGRDAIRWTLRDGDRVTGGSVYHLTNRVDGGPLAAQDYALVPAGATPRSLWRDVLAPMGLRLLVAVADAVAAGEGLPYAPQDERLATWEPALDTKPLHRPELLQLPGPGKGTPTRHRVGGLSPLRAAAAAWAV